MSTDHLGGRSEQFADLFYPLFEWLFGEDSEFVADLERKLAEARMEETVELYVSRAIGYGVLAGLFLWVLGTGLGYALFGLGLVGTDVSIGLPVSNPAIAAFLEALKVPALVLVTGLFFGAIGFVTGFGMLVLMPYNRAASRKREINMLLPDAVSFMYALSIGGLNQLEILEAMAQAEDTYGEVALEFRTIVQETEYFDVDYRTAIRRRSMETPSEDLSQFFTDMLSIINSGGDMAAFLEDKKETHMRTAKQQQELTLQTLELFGEMYMTLSLFPLLLIIVLVVMSMLGQSQEFLLYATVYVLLPMVSVAFLVMVSTVKQDEPGDGYLDLGAVQDGDELTRTVGDGGATPPAETALHRRLESRERRYALSQFLRQPHYYFREHPLITLVLTLPLTIGILAHAITSGLVPLSFSGLVDNPVGSTFIYVYVPLYVVGVPLAVFYEWNQHTRNRITGKLSENLRKLSSANDTGLTLLESIRTVADTSSGRLADEFDEMYAKVTYGMTLSRALVEFNNKYHVPRLARTVNLVTKAQEASSRITAVLSTAAQASENQDDIERERTSRARMQVVIIVMTYLTLLAVMVILQTQFLEVLSGLTSSAEGASGGAVGGASFGASLDVELLKLLFFHAVTIQGILAGVISGYISHARLLAGLKYAIVLPTIALVVWAFI
ncbi:type II secretion system F family protein [Halodesulfurarchaeum sp. HSR-GB]|uniref:type II secretion system F family protein n=1 Tax=Halodesulfurarchaeum sp. HSR-GB TaxID=3074077 RepID=UPI00285B255A|nr:type II secretion system F family protein [Halodesulfurarchaeum sp. HSR-GB]MDR5657018.1 type II secretion system F family protein [Halodesulfurarchaeum sp. HSR-GB]